MRWPERVVLALASAVIAALAGGCSSSALDAVLTPERGAWKRTGPVRRFVAANLHEIIDGQAPFVISFGFELLSEAEYRRAAEPATTVDLYDMGTADNAFALFRSNANVEGESVAIGAEGAGEDARIEFWQDRYYVVVSNPSAEEREPVLALARDVAAALPPGAGRPAYLDLLPADRRIGRSERYLPANFLGYECLQRAVSARYDLSGREVTLFACRYGSAEQSAQALETFRAQLQKRSPTRPLASGDGGRAPPGETGFVAPDFILGPLVIFRRGTFVGGATGASDDPAAVNLLADLDRRLAGT